MKTLILSIGEKFIDILAIIMLIAVVIGGFAQMGQMGFLSGLLAMLFGVIAVVMAFFFIYLVIDIRDGIRALNKSE